MACACSGIDPCGRGSRGVCSARQLATRARDQAAEQAGGGEAGPCGLLGQWVLMLDFRLHFCHQVPPLLDHVDNEETPPLLRCFRWWDGVAVWWS